MKVYYEQDASLDLLKEKKIAIIGYGSQGMPTHRILRKWYGYYSC